MLLAFWEKHTRISFPVFRIFGAFGQGEHRIGLTGSRHGGITKGGGLKLVSSLCRFLGTDFNGPASLQVRGTPVQRWGQISGELPEEGIRQARWSVWSR